MSAPHVGEGPRHFAWRRLRHRLNRIREETAQFNTDLASMKENNPACANLPIQPIVDDSPDLPPEPKFKE